MASRTETNLDAQERMGGFINAGDIDSLDEVFASDVVDHIMPRASARGRRITDLHSSYGPGAGR